MIEPQPPCYEAIPQLANVDQVMRDFARGAVERILEIPDATIAVPLNGSILPLYCVLRDLTENHPDQMGSVIERLRFMQDIKDENGMVAFLVDRDYDKASTMILLDDIADKLHVAKALLEAANHTVVVLAPVQKEHTAETHASIPWGHEIDIVPAVTTDNEWIASSAGMNEGITDPKSPLHRRAFLSTLQRFARDGYYKKNDSGTIEDKIHFFENQLLPWITEESDLFQLCYHLEMEKSNKRYEDMMYLSGRIVPYIMQTIAENPSFTA